MSLGVAVGATVLHLATEFSGAHLLGRAAFIPTFLIVGLIPILAIAVFAQLSPNAGAEMSGHRRKVVEEAIDNLGEPAYSISRRV